jgi:hypothetical protein
MVNLDSRRFAFVVLETLRRKGTHSGGTGEFARLRIDPGPVDSELHRSERRQRCAGTSWHPFWHSTSVSLAAFAPTQETDHRV